MYRITDMYCTYINMFAWIDGRTVSFLDMPILTLDTRVKWLLQSASFGHLDANESWTMIKIEPSATYRN